MKKIVFDNEELIGMKFGLLTILEIDENQNKGHDMAWCDCACGTRTLTRKSDVVRGHTLSCGCIAKKKRRKKTAGEPIKDGVVWNPTRHKFAAYAGGRLLGYFYEETIAEIVVKQINRRAA